MFKARAERTQTQETVTPDENEAMYPSDIRDSGVTIDLKEGKLEFWRTDQTIRPSGDTGDETGKHGG